MAKPWFVARAINASVGEITIYGDIGFGGVDAEAFYQKLTAMRGAKTLHVHINSDGGDVTVGFAISNMLARHPARKIVHVDGIAASMASVIAMVGDEILMPSNAFMMIHNPWGGAVGDAEDMRRHGQTLDMMREAILQSYVKRTGLDSARVGKMMDAETWINAEDAVKLGFADRIEAPLKMAAMLKAADLAKKFKGSPMRRDWEGLREDAFARFNRKPVFSRGTRSYREGGR